MDAEGGVDIRGYRILHTLGRGGMGTTFEAVREETGEHVALKRLAIAKVDEWKRLELFEREARILAGLSHPGIPRYVEHFTVDGDEGPTLYLVEELIPGRSLAEIVASSGAMAEPEVARLASELLVVLEYLGRQTPPVIHRDIKPENILRRPDGSVALVDFGASRADFAKPAGGSTTVGTYGYMAPEQLHGVAVPATDIHGLACTLLFLLIGRSPAELPRRKLHIDFTPHVRITPRFARWLATALQPVPEDRFASAEIALAALQGGSAGVPRRRTRPLTWALLGALGVVVAGAGIAFGVAGLHRIPRRPVAAAALSPAPLDPLPARWAPSRKIDALDLRPPFATHLSAVKAVAISPRGDRLATGGHDMALKLWDAKTHEPIRSFAGHSGPVDGVAWSPDGTWLASAGGERILVHDATTGAARLSLHEGGGQLITVDVAPDGKRIAGGAKDGVTRVWEADTGVLKYKVGQGAMVLCARFSPDGRWLATASGATIGIWDAATGAAVRTLAGHTDAVGSVAWGPDGHTLFSVADDRTLRRWYVDQGRLVGTVTDAFDELWNVALDPRGKYIATVGKDGYVRLHDSQTLRLSRERKIAAAPVLSVAFTPDGKTLFAGAADGRSSEIGPDIPSQADNVPPIPKDAPVARKANPRAAVYAKAMAIARSRDTHMPRALDEAERLLRDALKTDPANALLYVGLSWVRQHRGYRSGDDYDQDAIDEADKLVSKALELSPKLAEAHVRRGYLLEAKRDYLGAKDEALLAEKLDPSYAWAQLLLATLAFHSGDDKAAERYALASIPLSAAFEASVAFDLLADVYAHRWDYRAADVAHQRELELDPRGAWPKGNYAQFLVGRGEYDRAIEMANAALAILDYGFARQTLAQAYAAKGAEILWGRRDPELAKSLFDEAIRADAESSSARYCLGAYFRLRAFTTHDVSLLDRSNKELDLATRASPKWELPARARAENDRLRAVVGARPAAAR